MLSLVCVLAYLLLDLYRVLRLPADVMLKMEIECSNHPTFGCRLSTLDTFLASEPAK